jgi:dTDP-4-dehydrorhamnose reductase
LLRGAEHFHQRSLRRQILFCLGMGTAMKVLILGGAGMMGHQLWKTFLGRFDTFVTLRKSITGYDGFFRKECTVEGISAEDFDSVVGALARIRPQVVVNCIGVVKQQGAAKDPLSCIGVNALFPHRLARLCQATSARLIHLSTDCVFSGKKGNYREEDHPDPEDLYGRSKLLGEVAGPGCLTIRTSIIGRELNSSQGLLEWFLTQKGKKVSGYRKAIFSGLTTGSLANLMSEIITKHPTLEGVWHVASDPISKYELLRLVRKTFDVKTDIEPDDTFLCDRSLCGDKFRQAAGWAPLPWPRMIADLRNEIAFYGTD